MSDSKLPSNQMVLNTDPEAATFVTVSGWRSRDGFFYANDERMARWSGCTHILCECGKPTPKSYTKCEECRTKADRERYLDLPVVDAGDGPFYMYRDDRYFWSLQDVYDYCYDEDIKPSDLMLVLAEPEYAREVDEDYWSDDLPEDGELPSDIAEALEALNKVIRERKEPICWHASNKRVVIPDEVPA